MKKHLLKKYTVAAVNGVLTEGEIRAIKSRLSYITLSGRSDTELNEMDNKYHMIDVIRQYKPKVTPEQAAKGLAWLHSKAYTATGKLTKNNPFTPEQLSILNNGSYFKLVDFTEFSNGFKYNFYPVYRLFDNKGNWFDYLSSAWQAGISIEVLETHCSTKEAA